MYLRTVGNISIKGRVKATITDSKGNVLKESEWSDNQETIHSAEVVAAWLCGANNTGYQPTLPPGYMELGTGSGTPSSSDTTLFTAVSGTNQKCSVVQPVADSNGNLTIAQYVCQYYGTANNSGTFTEVGLMDSNGKLFGHIMYAVTIEQGLTTTITWQLPVTV